MTSVSQRTVTETVTRHEVIVPLPATRTDMYLALTWADQKYEQVHGCKPEHDDAYWVRADDEEIVAWFEVKKEVS